MAGEREEGWDISWPAEAPWDAYYAALGRLMHMFGRTEVKLHRVLKDMIFDFTDAGSGAIDLPILDALTGSMRMNPLRDSIKRVLRVVEASSVIVGEFDYILKQLGDIQSFRDRVAHHAADGSTHEVGNTIHQMT